jgi:hypothetical protein
MPRRSSTTRPRRHHDAGEAADDTVRLRTYWNGHDDGHEWIGERDPSVASPLVARLFVVGTSIGINIFVAPADGHEPTVHRRTRTLRRAHPADRGHFLVTVIHHARSQRCTFAQAQRPVAIAVISSAVRRLLVPCTGVADLRFPTRLPARRGAVSLAPVARLADLEEAHAEDTSLEAKQKAIHRVSDRDDEKLALYADNEHLARSRRPSAWGLGRQSEAPFLFRRLR